jgi:signal peptidase I
MQNQMSDSNQNPPQNPLQPDHQPDNIIENPSQTPPPQPPPPTPLQNPAAVEPEKPKMNNYLRLFLEFLKNIAIIIVLAGLIQYFIVQLFVVDGSSMEPNFHNNEYLLIQKVSAHFSGYSRGDVVVFKYPKDTRLDFIKRIIGTPGDTVTLDDTGIMITNAQNPRGFYLSENYLSTKYSYSDRQTVSLGDGQYFVMGDNRDNSSDSREWGILDKHYIIGKTWFVLYPFHNFQRITDPSY